MQSKILMYYCHKFSATYVKTGSVGINEHDFSANSIKLYPNPVFNTLYIEDGNADIISEIKIYSIQGNLIINAKGNQIDVSSLPRGTYLIKITNETSKVVKKFIKE